MNRKFEIQMIADAVHDLMSRMPDDMEKVGKQYYRMHQAEIVTSVCSLEKFLAESQAWHSDASSNWELYMTQYAEDLEALGRYSELLADPDEASGLVSVSDSEYHLLFEGYVGKGV